VFPATSNKREIADKQRMDKTNNNFWKVPRASFCPLFKKRGGQVKIQTCP